MSWENVIGQRRVKEILRAALARQRLPHAYLFSGPQGVGKDAAALELAKTVNCERSEVEACGKCPSCGRMERLQHPNLNLVFALPVGKNEKYGDSPIAKISEEEIVLMQQELQRKADNPYHRISLPRANTIKINSIRDIRKEVSLSMYERGRKVFIIIDAENLSEESSNALLKTLEEPHAGALFILTTSQPERLLQTIVSRCQHLRFESLTPEEVRAALQSRHKLDASKADLIARVARGSYLRAVELVGIGVEEYYAEVLQFLRTVLYKSRKELLSEMERIFSEYQKPEVEEFFVVLQSWFHKAMILSERGPDVQSPGDGEAMRKFVEHHGSLEYAALFEITERAISLLNKNVYIPLILMNLALQLKEKIISPGVHQ